VPADAFFLIGWLPTRHELRSTAFLRAAGRRSGVEERPAGTELRIAIIVSICLAASAAIAHAPNSVCNPSTRGTGAPGETGANDK
jgi:hypothetical protein